MLTGYTRPPRFHRILLAPQHLKKALKARIQRETDHAATAGPLAWSSR